MNYRLIEADLYILCNDLRAMLKNGHIVLLQGEIGSGKTTLVRAFVEHTQKHKSTQVQSPTFSLALAYESAQYGAIYHYDMYRKSPQDMLELGLLDMLMQEGLHFVEWGDNNMQNLLKTSGFHVIGIHITPTQGQQDRIYEVSL
ncbi:tRNA (adenosine(37)-N6)-threonylcarbamoyltransferase complex ATPase subunit type 1 TsaE [Helicobacter jaachi]|nr:tRNA (adenosine(37)-N6)-threonylcarbamoyltransferase complex ATPase subunit type 1 TsaE [Helicobacter jaachi]